MITLEVLEARIIIVLQSLNHKLRICFLHIARNPPSRLQATLGFEGAEHEAKANVNPVDQYLMQFNFMSEERMHLLMPKMYY